MFSTVIKQTLLCAATISGNAACVLVALTYLPEFVNHILVASLSSGFIIVWCIMRVTGSSRQSTDLSFTRNYVWTSPAVTLVANNAGFALYVLAIPMFTFGIVACWSVLPTEMFYMFGVATFVNAAAAFDIRRRMGDVGVHA